MRKGQLLDKAGRRFGRLLVIGFSHMRGRTSMWRCRCDCGNEHAVSSNNLTSNHTRSCGCLENEARKKRHAEMVKHGKSSSIEFRTWTHLRGRCNNPTDSAYAGYGGRGIKVCERWDSFANFLADMGPRPKGTSIDRIDNDGDYCPENCRWASSTQQGRNRRTTRMVEWEGRRLSLSDFCDQMRLNYERVYHRVQRGYTIEQAISPLDFRITPRN